MMKKNYFIVTFYFYFYFLVSNTENLNSLFTYEGVYQYLIQK